MLLIEDAFGGVIDVNVIIENAMGGPPVKYELDKDSGHLRMDRMLYSAVHYPQNYGFIPRTLHEDNDPLDIIVVGQVPVVPGAVIPCRPIGVLMMTDDKGQDEKILAVPHPKLTRYYEKIKHYQDLPDILVERIVHFFQHYKDLEPGKWVKLLGWGDVDEARRLIVEAIERAKARR